MSYEYVSYSPRHHAWRKMNALLQVQLHSKISFRLQIRRFILLFKIQQSIQLPPRMMSRTVNKVLHEFRTSIFVTIEIIRTNHASHAIICRFKSIGSRTNQFGFENHGSASGRIKMVLNRIESYQNSSNRFEFYDRCQFISICFRFFVLPTRVC